jgi:hypothetical protein
MCATTIYSMRVTACYKPGQATCRARPNVYMYVCQWLYIPHPPPPQYWEQADLHGRGKSVQLTAHGSEESGIRSSQTQNYRLLKSDYCWLWLNLRNFHNLQKFTERSSNVLKRLLAG